MASKKRPKTRDKEQTIRKLIDVVGEIMRESGNAGLNEVQITNRTGHHRSIIRHHFHSLLNLKKAYIQEKDYWSKFFERFSLPDKPGEEEVRQLFVELMQENFRYFHKDREMQKIILWQISEINPMLRAISDSREIAGAELLQKTDAHFKGSGTDFRSVIALLLGGIYYIVLHSRSNGSVVAGIDVNLPRDRAKLLRSIGQVINWAWDSPNTDTPASKHQPSNYNTYTTPMNYETEVIEAIAFELSEKGKSQPIPLSADVPLSLEARRLLKVFQKHLLSLDNPTMVQIFLNMNLQKLVKVCDRLYLVHGQTSPDTQVILDLLGGLKQIIPLQVDRKVSLPLAFIDEQSKVLHPRFERLRQTLIEKGVDPILTEISGIPFQRFRAGGDKINWGDYCWLKRYFVLLENIDWIVPNCPTPNDVLLSQLIRMEYNHQRFFAYCYRQVRQRADQFKGRKNKLRELAVCKALVLQDSPIAEHRFESRTERISVQLSAWIDAEMTLVSETETDDPAEGFVNPFKLLYKLNILSTAFWLKLQYDHGVFEEESLDTLAEKTAHNCSTKSQPDPSAKSIKSKFYTKDPQVIKSIETLLVHMLEDVRKLLH